LAIAIYPVITGASTSTATYGVVVPAGATQYKLVADFASGQYTVTSLPTASVVTVTFVLSDNTTFSLTTSSGTVTGVLLKNAAYAYVSMNLAGQANTSVSIQRTALFVSSTGLSGTTDTLTTSGTYNAATGMVLVLAVGGGGGGSGARTNRVDRMGAGGGYGNPTQGFTYLNGPTSYTVGARGNGGAANVAGNAGGSSIFGNVTGVGGNGGNTDATNGGTGGTPGGGNYGDGSGSTPGTANTANYKDFFANATTGGGGGGNQNPGGGSNGAGSGIGTGGRGGGQGTNDIAQSGTGYGSGGGGGGGYQASVQSGGNGAPGVIYVLRGI